MVSQTTLTTHKSQDSIPAYATLSRFINRKPVSVSFPIDVHVTTIESYFNLDDEMFYQLRDRKLREYNNNEKS